MAAMGSSSGRQRARSDGANDRVHSDRPCGPLDTRQPTPASMGRMRSPNRGFLTGFRVHVRNRGYFTGVRVQIPPRPHSTVNFHQFWYRLNTRWWGVAPNGCITRPGGGWGGWCFFFPIFVKPPPARVSEWSFSRRAGQESLRPAPHRFTCRLPHSRLGPSPGEPAVTAQPLSPVIPRSGTAVSRERPGGCRWPAGGSPAVARGRRVRARPHRSLGPALRAGRRRRAGLVRRRPADPHRRRGRGSREVCSAESCTALLARWIRSRGG